MHGFRDGFLPYVGGEVKEVFEDLKRRVDPQVVFTHAGYDFHQDHRLACELTWNTFRNHLILEYEIPKVDGDLGRPNVFVPLTRDWSSGSSTCSSGISRPRPESTGSTRDVPRADAPARAWRRSRRSVSRRLHLP